MAELNGYFFRNLLKKTRRRFALCAGEQALYTELIDICNEENWCTSFQVSNGELTTALNCNEKTLHTWRQSLVNAGLIKYSSGKSKRAFGNYVIATELVVNFTTNSTTNHSTDKGVNPSTNPSDYNKLNKTKLNNSFSPQAVNPKNEKKNSRDYWDKIIEAWFVFYGNNFKTKENLPAKPLFKKVQAAQLGNIYDALKKTCIDAGKEWTQDYAIYCHKGFFQLAYNDRWLSKHFELGNLVSQFNSIVNNKKEENAHKQNIKSITGNNGKSGGAISLANELAAEIGLT